MNEYIEVGADDAHLAPSELTPGLETVRFNAHHNFTLQYPVLLAPLRVEDDERERLRRAAEKCSRTHR